MTKLKFTLRPESCARIHDALTCLNKFSDVVRLEARTSQLSFSALNLSKSGHASFTLEASRFFGSYQFVSQDSEGHFTCEFSNKALQSVFKSRLLDVKRGETAIDRCEVALQEDAEEAACRFIFKMICDQGVVKTYRLTYETQEPLHVSFDKHEADNKWSMRSTFLRDYMEYFGPRTEQLDIFFESGLVTFTSFTEKIVGANKEVLRQPLQTAVSISVNDFEEVSVRDQSRIKINVKDFRSVVTHAVTMNAQLSSRFSMAGSALQFHYEAFGIQSSFILMTARDGRSMTPASTIAARGPNRSSAPPGARPSSVQMLPRTTSKPSRDMPPPVKPASRPTLGQATTSGSALSPQSTARPLYDGEGLFVQDDEDLQWDPQNLDDADGLRWDATVSNAENYQPTFKDTASTARAPPIDTEEGIQPTQRLSQIKGLF